MRSIHLSLLSCRSWAKEKKKYLETFSKGEQPEGTKKISYCHTAKIIDKGDTEQYGIYY